MKTRLTYAMKNYLPWTLLALAVSYPLFGQGTLTKERILCLTPEQEEIFSHMGIVFLPDGLGGTAKTIRFTGVNVQVVNGLDSTNGFPFDPDSVDPLDTVVNGVGNLVVGYNELGNPLGFGDDRTGSHNIVVGHGNNYTSFGGFVGPRDNMTSAPFASVTGGRLNKAAGLSSSVSGGCANSASGKYSSVSGGGELYAYAGTYIGGNKARGNFSSVSGGSYNTASGDSSSVSGGILNRASGHASSVSGGGGGYNGGNVASGYASSVSGGGGGYFGGNVASGYASSVSGGGGGSFGGNVASGNFSSVSGGSYNTASGGFSSVSGGDNRSVSGTWNWRGGKYYSNN